MTEAILGVSMTIFYLPDLGEGLAEAEIREWYVKVGDTVKVDQPLVSMETAKAVVDVPSPYAAKIVELHGSPNQIVKTGAPLITFEVENASKDQGSVVGKLDSHDKQWEEQEVIIGTPSTRVANKKILPAARVLAQELKIDWSKITGSGPQGIITVADIKQHHQPARSLGHEAEALHGVRRVMAQAMVLSHREVVPVTIFDDANITNLPADQDLSVLLLQAIVKACQMEPALNAWFDGVNLERKLFKEVNVGVAVDSTEGLIVPVIKAVETLSKNDIRKQIDRFKQAAQDRTFASAELQGATFILSNFGTIAGRYATPIIVPPTVAILGCGRYRNEPIVKDNQLTVGRLLPLSLTFDHRAVTGGEATRFLGKVIDVLQG